MSVLTDDGYNTTVGADHVARPVVRQISPTAGPAAGGTVLTITGWRLAGSTGVLVQNSAGTAFTVESAAVIKVTTPAGAAGVGDVVVQHPAGDAVVEAAFTYEAPE